jgi:NADPH:quinone reductase-like Zn-dependent oxidoreductase
MKAVVYTEYGDPDVLKIIKIEKPVPADNEILVKVFASSVTSGVAFIRRGKHPDSRFFTLMLRIFLGFTRPRKSILGYEVAGEIEAVGKKVRSFKTGDKVFGTTTGLKNGAYAEYVCLPERWKSGVVALKPENLNYEEAAAIPVGAMAGLYTLNKANIQKGQSILVYGASGSVGTYVVQLAKYYGAEVTGVCSTGNLEMIQSIGASTTIDYTKKKFTENGEKYDVIFDAVGKLSKSDCRQSLKKSGHFLSTNTPTKELTDNLLFLKNLFEKGSLKPVIDKCFPLEQIVEAHKYTDTGHKKGNVVIEVKHNGD